MSYEISKDKIIIKSKEDFSAKDTLECGQVFSYKKDGDCYLVFSADKAARVIEKDNGYEIITSDPLYFEDYFDLKTDYKKIKAELKKYDILKRPIEYGSGIRLLRQNLFETVISFIVSANNNIKRIQMILDRLRQKLGKCMGDFYAFPTCKEMQKADIDFFKQIGAGYRADYLYKVVRQIDESVLEEWKNLDTEELRKKLIELSGVGPKVADCILLFGYARMDVFPVDTWISKMYNMFYEPLENREKIRHNLVKEFGNLSGYAQQYLFYSIRENEIEKN